MMETLRDQLIRHEGLKLKPYRCSAGKLTVGVGRNLDDVGITRDEAMYMLANDIARAKSEIFRAMPWIAAIDEARRDVLVNMCFNLGLARLLKFENTLALVSAGKYDEAADAMLQSKWASQVGGRATELAEIMRTGVRK